MGKETAEIKLASGREWRKWLTSLLVLVVLSVGFVYVLGGPQAFVTKARTLFGVGPRSESSAPVDAFREQKIVVDETVAVTAGGVQARGFTLHEAAAVRIVVDGATDTAKGFSVYFIEADQLAAVGRHEPFKRFEAFGGDKIGGFDETHRIPPGSYFVVLHNSQNWFNTMQVKIKIIVNPAP